MFPLRPAAFWFGAALVVAVSIVYLPALGAGFIWDDDAHVTARALRSWSGLWRIWTDLGATQQFYPLLHSAFWLEHRLWGSNPMGYHLTNVGLHIIAAFLLANLLQRLHVRGALIAATLFALHPVHVESVAWISEQKNTLSTVFYLAAAGWYVRFDATRERRIYCTAIAFFLLALLTKTVTATLPAALLVVLWWRRGVLTRRDVWPLVPWFAIAVVAGLVTAWVERTIVGADGAAFDLTPVQRVLLATRVIWFYLGKLLWPANLTFIYPRWEIDAAGWTNWLHVFGTLGLLAVFWRLRARFRAPLAVALLFAGGLFPVLGFLNVYPFQYSFVADHFQYLASIPVIAAAGAALAPAWSKVRATWPAGAPAGLCLLLAAFGFLGRQQTRIYHNNETLFRTTITRNPTSWMAYNNLGHELMKAKAHLPEAVTHLRRAVALRWNYPEAQNNLGLALTQLGQPAEAIPHLTTALRLKPNSYQTHNNLGIALASSGRAAEALLAFAQAAALNPTLSNIHENWGKALVLMGREAEAAERFKIAAGLRPLAVP